MPQFWVCGCEFGPEDAILRFRLQGLMFGTKVYSKQLVYGWSRGACTIVSI